MTRLRNVVLGSLAALAIGGVASSALAMESGTFQNRLNGATIGLPLGALPPPGLYSGLETAYLGWGGVGPNGTGNQAAHLYLPAIAQAIPLLWVPGWNFLGATYAMSVVQAFYEFQVLAASPGAPFSSTPPGAVLAAGYNMANTTWNPIDLSWNLGGGWFVSLGFNFMGPDGTAMSVRQTPTTGRLSPRLRPLIWPTTGTWPRTSSMTSTPSQAAEY